MVVTAVVRTSFQTPALCLNPGFTTESLSSSVKRQWCEKSSHQS